MRRRPARLLFPLLVLGLVGLALWREPRGPVFAHPDDALADGLVEQLELGSSGELRLESFRLVRRGKAWAAERDPLGTARLLRGRAVGRPQLEQDLTFGPAGAPATRVHRVLRGLEAPGTWSFVAREWRATGAEGERLSGRGLVLDAEADGTLRLREWAGVDQRSAELLGPGSPDRATTPLAWLEARRTVTAGPARVVTVFDPVEARLVDSLALETPLAPGLGRGLRLVDLVTLEAGPDGRARAAGRPMRWLLFGDEVLAWLEGDLEAWRAPADVAVATR